MPDAPTDTDVDVDVEVDADRSVGRGPAWALAAAPVVFVAGWAVAGATWASYSTQRQAISDLAAVDSPRRWLMFVVFVAYGLLMLIGSMALRHSLLRAAWPLAALNGLALIVVAVTPIHHSSWLDARHGNAALFSYFTIAALPVFGASGLAAAGRWWAAIASVVVGAASLASLAMAYDNDYVGWFQRAGAGLSNVWTLTIAIVLLGGALAAPSVPEPAGPPDR